MGTIDILENIRKELHANIDNKYKEDNKRFFKTKVGSYGVRTPIVRKIAKKYFKQIMLLEKEEIFELCENLFKTEYSEETTIAIQWIAGIRIRWSKEDFEKLDLLYEYIDNWGKCDDFCLNVISHFIVKFPQFKRNVLDWSKSENLWRRRASAVTFIQGGSWSIHKDYLGDTLNVAKQLLLDKEDLVQKGYGWMLKIASETNQKEIFNFVMENKAIMPRTALRYSIEKMPADLRKQAMKKD